MQTMKKEAVREFTQFEITSDLLRNLYKFNLTPVTKLVLLELTTHLNEYKNGSVVFPSVGYIAEVLGIGLTAAKKAINDLIKEGVIIKAKRSKIRGNYNKYVFTQKVRNLTSEQSEIELFKRSESDLFMLTNNNEQKKQQTEFFKSGGNVYSEDEEILRDYAIKHGARNINAYIRTLKSTKSAENIISEYKKKGTPARSVHYTSKILQQYEEFKKDAVSYETSPAWMELKKKLGF